MSSSLAASIQFFVADARQLNWNLSPFRQPSQQFHDDWNQLFTR